MDILDLRNVVFVVKKLVDWFKSKLGIVDVRVNELKDKLIKNNKIEVQRGNKELKKLKSNRVQEV